jgi:hypothetical protein
MVDPAHRGDADLVEIVAAEHHPGDVADRHADPALFGTVRRVVVGNRPRLDCAAARIEAEDIVLALAPPGAVDPAEKPCLHIPERALAEILLAGDDAFDFVGYGIRFLVRCGVRCTINHSYTARGIGNVSPDSLLCTSPQEKVFHG